MAELHELRRHLFAEARAQRPEASFDAVAAAKREFGLQVDLRLDRGLGRCPMRDPRLADLVAGALRFFEGARYELYAWCVMPNHVHVVAEPIAEHPLSDVVQAWKSYTAHEARRITGNSGNLCQREYYDRVIRDEEELIATLRYVDENPVKAGLVDWKWVWCRERTW